MAATGYDRKYALVLLHKKHAVIDSLSLKPKVRVGAQLYDEQFRHVLIKVWNTANQVCSKRFVPFIPDIVAAMERHGHLRISDDIRKKLMTVSAATVDRILKPERSRQAQGLSQTKAGTLLKNKVQVRTFADWNDVIPGFFEVVSTLTKVVRFGGADVILDYNGGSLCILMKIGSELCSSILTVERERRR